MEQIEEKIRKELDTLLESIKTVEDQNKFRNILDDYIDEGYNVKEYIIKYNLLVQKLYKK